MSSSSTPKADIYVLMSTRLNICGSQSLFGMLDYRAHKLFWLLTLPLRLVGWLLISSPLALESPSPNGPNIRHCSKS